MHDKLEATWRELNSTANHGECKILRIGTLPTLKESDINRDNISSNPRYDRLNKSVMNKIGSNSFDFSIEGKEKLDLECNNILIEGATTSLQIHINLDRDLMTHFYNASLLTSGPLVAISANSPFLFEKMLWAETRIAIFERAIKLNSEPTGNGNSISRVGLGGGYCKNCLSELFDENVELFPYSIANSTKELF